MSGINEGIERAVHRHAGVLQIIQALISGLLLIFISNFYTSAKESNAASVDQAKAMIGMQSQISAVATQVAAVQQQLQGVTTMAISQAKNEIKQQELERRIYELEQGKKLK